MCSVRPRGFCSSTDEIAGTQTRPDRPRAVVHHRNSLLASEQSSVGFRRRGRRLSRPPAHHHRSGRADGAARRRTGTTRRALPYPSRTFGSDTNDCGPISTRRSASPTWSRYSTTAVHAPHSGRAPGTPMTPSSEKRVGPHGHPTLFGVETLAGTRPHPTRIDDRAALSLRRGPINGKLADSCSYASRPRSAQIFCETLCCSTGSRAELCPHAASIQVSVLAFALSFTTPEDEDLRPVLVQRTRMTEGCDQHRYRHLLHVMNHLLSE